MRTKFVERRRGKDAIAQLSMIIALFAWFSFIAALLAFHYARPEQSYEGVIAASRVQVRTVWQTQLQHVFISLLWSSWALSLFGMGINNRRSRRLSDHFKVNFTVLCVISSFCLAIYYVQL